MKSVLPISTLLLAAILLTPAMGYTIQVQNPNNYSISVGPHASFSIGSGTPAHELNYTEAATPYAVPLPPTVTATKTPYTFTTLGPVSYSISTPTTQAERPLGPDHPPCGQVGIDESGTAGSSGRSNHPGSHSRC